MKIWHCKQEERELLGMASTLIAYDSERAEQEEQEFNGQQTSEKVLLLERGWQMYSTQILLE